MTRLILLSIALVLAQNSFAQTQIRDVINSYVSISQINYPSQSANVSDATSFTVGDLVLIIQMKGAKIDESQNNNFGTINDINGAGNYEFHRVCRKNGNEVFFHNPIKTNFDNSGSLQLIRVPEYTNAQLIGNIFCDPWDGSTGGVIVLSLTGTLDVGNFAINASGRGFRGGVAFDNGSGCLPLSLSLAYTDKNSTNDRAHKGEGIAEFIPTKECSRGPQANGGGGGNNHNGGGSGGANYGKGGAGGQRIKYSSLACGSVAGLNSKSLNAYYNQNKIFMGGGGGAGHGNNAGSDGESGENGGGIIIIRAITLSGSGGKIEANGYSVALNSESEGAGGGGAGGSILLDVTGIAGSLSVEANGGSGGSVDNIGNQNCSGPGGGGGGGTILTTLANFPASINTSTSGGSCGITATATQSGCPVGGKNGGQDGDAGSSLFSQTISDESDWPRFTQTSATGCNKYTSPSGMFTWTQPGIYNDTLVNAAGCDSLLQIQVSIETIDMMVNVENNILMAQVQTGVTYQWYDCENGKIINGETSPVFAPLTNGRYAVIISKSGCSDTSDCTTLSTVGISEMSVGAVKLYPNPSSNGEFHFSIPSSLASITYSVWTVEGKLILKEPSPVSDGARLQIQEKGVYVIRIESPLGVTFARIIHQ